MVQQHLSDIISVRYTYTRRHNIRQLSSSSSSSSNSNSLSDDDFFDNLPPLDLTTHSIRSSLPPPPNLIKMKKEELDDDDRSSNSSTIITTDGGEEVTTTLKKSTLSDMMDIMANNKEVEVSSSSAQRMSKLTNNHTNYQSDIPSAYQTFSTPPTPKSIGGKMGNNLSSKSKSKQRGNIRARRIRRGEGKRLSGDQKGRLSGALLGNGVKEDPIDDVVDKDWSDDVVLVPMMSLDANLDRKVALMEFKAEHMKRMDELHPRSGTSPQITHGQRLEWHERLIEEIKQFENEFLVNGSRTSIGRMMFFKMKDLRVLEEYGVTPTQSRDIRHLNKTGNKTAAARTVYLQGRLILRRQRWIAEEKENPLSNNHVALSGDQKGRLSGALLGNDVNEPLDGVVLVTEMSLGANLDRKAALMAFKAEHIRRMDERYHRCSGTSPKITRGTRLKWHKRLIEEIQQLENEFLENGSSTPIERNMFFKMMDLRFLEEFGLTPNDKSTIRRSDKTPKDTAARKASLQREYNLRRQRWIAEEKETPLSNNHVAPSASGANAVEAKRHQMQQAASNGEYILAGRLQGEVERMEELQRAMKEAANQNDFIQAGKLQIQLNELAGDESINDDNDDVDEFKDDDEEENSGDDMLISIDKEDVYEEDEEGSDDGSDLDDICDDDIGEEDTSSDSESDDGYIDRTAVQVPSTTVHDIKWNKRYEDLVEYKNSTGHANVPRTLGPLGNWVKNQRKVFLEGKLSSDRTERLDSIGFEWINPTALELKWNHRLEELVEYKNSTGHTNVPRTSGPLGEWVSNQRKRQGKLTPDRIEKLNLIGFQWSLIGNKD